MHPMGEAQAESVALSTLGWLVAHEDLLPVFLGATGGSVEDMRTRLADSDFLISVLDVVLMDDAWVTEAAAAQSRPPEDLMRARHGLPGGAPVHWT